MIFFLLYNSSENISDILFFTSFSYKKLIFQLKEYIKFINTFYSKIKKGLIITKPELQKATEYFNKIIQNEKILFITGLPGSGCSFLANVLYTTNYAKIVNVYQLIYQRIFAKYHDDKFFIKGQYSSIIYMKDFFFDIFTELETQLLHVTNLSIPIIIICPYIYKYMINFKDYPMIYIDCSLEDALHNLDTTLLCEELVTGEESYQFSNKPFLSVPDYYMKKLQSQSIIPYNALILSTKKMCSELIGNTYHPEEKETLIVKGYRKVFDNFLEQCYKLSKVDKEKNTEVLLSLYDIHFDNLLKLLNIPGKQWDRILPIFNKCINFNIKSNGLDDKFYLHEHLIYTADYVKERLKELNIDNHTKRLFFLAVLFHDVGKVLTQCKFGRILLNTEVFSKDEVVEVLENENNFLRCTQIADLHNVPINPFTKFFDGKSELLQNSVDDLRTQLLTRQFVEVDDTMYYPNHHIIGALEVFRSLSLSTTFSQKDLLYIYQLILNHEIFTIYETKEEILNSLKMNMFDEHLPELILFTEADKLINHKDTTKIQELLNEFIV